MSDQDTNVNEQEDISNKEELNENASMVINYLNAETDEEKQLIMECFKELSPEDKNKNIEILVELIGDSNSLLVELLKPLKFSIINSVLIKNVNNERIHNVFYAGDIEHHLLNLELIKAWFRKAIDKKLEKDD